jgi:L-serine dehydratase
MAVSVFDLFKIGIGPSSSHTVGPMRAALLFVQSLERDALIGRTARVRVELYGSLGATGKGHGTDRGILLGLMGDAPDTVDPATIAARLAQVQRTQQLPLLGGRPVRFIAKDQMLFYRQALPEHPNGMKFYAYDAADELLRTTTYLSVGGGFVVTAGTANSKVLGAHEQLPYPFHNGRELLAMCSESGFPVARLMWENERFWRSEAEIRSGLLHIWDVMQACTARGLGIDNPDAEGELAGPLHVKRRAPKLYRALMQAATEQAADAAGDGTLKLPSDPLAVIDWINVFAIAVNEENAAGGRVVTAPTNGAAGIIPAVLHYYIRFMRGASEQGVIDFLLTAGAIGILYKLNASISGAEVGCQGEVGVACSMAAGALAAVMGGTPEQVENAAEIGMEHNLGLTCDPVGGLVQIPCIERNAMGAVKAVNAARMALSGDGSHYVSLDSVIKTMRETGADMKTKYKETSRGGLAVNIVEC